MTKYTKIIEEAIKLKKQQKFEEALELLNKIRNEDPNSEEVKKALIKILLDYGGYLNDEMVLGGYDKAIVYFKKIIDLDPNNYRAWYNLGIAYFNIDNPKLALESYKKALEINPDYMYCYYNMGLFFEVVDQDFEKALKYYEKALSYDENFMYALNARNDVRKKLDLLKMDKSYNLEIDTPSTSDTGNLKKCKKCGTLNRDSAKFCDNCGEKF
ncbi:MAG: tetratricopeptide repeat protein [Promethearchaeota archaeon]|nr:MAG: tetratricopeptide repeat protein [Candidatus Lokiarchaeota archaeon]